jgi:hypothetical protein
LLASSFLAGTLHRPSLILAGADGNAFLGLPKDIDLPVAEAVVVVAVPLADPVPVEPPVELGAIEGVSSTGCPG